MYRIQAKMGRKWVWGLNDYETIEMAEERQSVMNQVGIQTRIKHRDLLFK